MRRTADIVICGAGITGISAAHFLSRAGFKNILLLDEHPPLSFTNDRSTECYRNWWPDPEMLALMNHSIDLMEAFANEGGNVFRMNRRGYLYVTANENKIADLENASRVTSSRGAGQLRVHSSDACSYPQSHPEGFGGWRGLADWQRTHSPTLSISDGTCPGRAARPTCRLVERATAGHVPARNGTQARGPV